MLAAAGGGGAAGVDDADAGSGSGTAADIVVPVETGMVTGRLVGIVPEIVVDIQHIGQQAFG